LESDWRTLLSQSELHVEPASSQAAKGKNQNLSLFWPTDWSASLDGGSPASCLGEFFFDPKGLMSFARRWIDK
jgi:hypothetical protein